MWGTSRESEGGGRVRLEIQIEFSSNAETKEGKMSSMRIMCSSKDQWLRMMPEYTNIGQIGDKRSLRRILGRSSQTREVLEVQFSWVELLSHVWLFATPWTGTAARQASLSITNSWSLLKLMSMELMMPSNHLILSFLSSPFYEPGLSPQDHLSHCKAPADLCSQNLSLQVTAAADKAPSRGANGHRGRVQPRPAHPLRVAEAVLSMLVPGSISGSLVLTTKTTEWRPGTRQQGPGAKWSWLTGALIYVHRYSLKTIF